MLKPLLVLIASIVANISTNDFGTIYLTERETLDLKLHEYFPSNYLEFFISNTNSTENEAKIYHHSDFELITFIPHDQNFRKKSSSNYDRFLSWKSSHGHIFIDYNLNCIDLYLIPLGQESIQKLWSKQIFEDDKYTAISQIGLNLKYQIFLTILAKTSVETNNQKIWKNEMYILNLSNYFQCDEPVKLDLWDVKYVKDLKVSQIQYSNIVELFGRLNSGSQIIFVYDFKDMYNPILIQTIDQYYSLPLLKNNSLSIISGIAAKVGACNLDENFGLVYYKPIFGIGLQETHHVDLRNYGKIYGMTHFLEDPLNKILVNTEFGVVVISDKLFFSEEYWLDTFNVNEKGASAKSSDWIEESSDYFVYTEEGNSNYLLMYQRYNDKQELVHILDVKELIGSKFDSKGAWRILWANNKKYYLRSDFDGIRLFHINLQDWTLRLLGDRSFYVEITARAGENQKKYHKKSLNVISLPLGSSEVYKNWRYQKAKINPWNIYFDGYQNELKIPADSIFSGPNLTFYVQSISIPDSFSINFKLPEIGIISKIISLPLNIFKVKIGQNFVFGISSDGVFIYNGKGYEILRYKC